jgi:hypothetical protein
MGIVIHRIFLSRFFMVRNALCVMSLVVSCAVAAAQQPPAGTETAPGLDLAAAANWPLEHIELKGGRVYRGLVLSPELHETAQSVSFEEVKRQAGRPMSTLVWSFPKESIAKIDLLPAADRTELIERLDWFRNRGALAAQEMAQIVLTKGESGGARWIYQAGPWFRLESWTDKEMTRLTILRIEQIFAAYSAILPSRTRPERPLRMVLFGSMREYAEFQAQLKFKVKNPALYVPKLNLLAAGSELNAYSGRLEKVREHHKAIQKKYDQAAAAMPAALKKLLDDLAKSGLSASERRTIRLSAERKWKDELAEFDRRLQAIERGNNAQFDLVVKEMLARLYHEAFHAYLENFVYPLDQTDVPRWLNEGLAQVFDEGQLELGTLRLDAPNRERLAALKADLRGSPGSLADVLTADASTFLVSHSMSADVSQRHYLYSWGLAHYLALREPILETARLDRYVSPQTSQSDAISRFEQLVGKPLPQFEALWRAEMLALP